MAERTETPGRRLRGVEAVIAIVIDADAVYADTRALLRGEAGTRVALDAVRTG